MEIILISYVVQIPLALYAAFWIPRPPGLGEKTQRLRNLVIGAGLLPCGPLSVVAQIIYLLMYFAAIKVKRVQGARQEQAFKQKIGDVPTPSSGNPFGGPATQTPATPQANPFGAPAANPQATGQNPFGGASPTGQVGDAPSSDNPFA